MPKPSALVGMPSWTGRVVREPEHGIRPRVPRQLFQVMACGLCGIISLPETCMMPWWYVCLVSEV